MNKIKIIFIIAAFTTIISCNKNELTETSIPTKDTYEVKSLTANDETLSFNSKEEMEIVIDELLQMDKETLKTWYSSKNDEFTSQNSIFEEAMNEFQQATDFDTANKIKDKYKKHLLFNENPMDQELYNPYLPSENMLGYALICNKNGDVLINGKIENFNTLKSVRETNFYKHTHTLTKTINESLNYLYILDGKRKMWAETAIAHGGQCFIKVTAHKKTILGWNKYPTRYGFSIITYNSKDWKEVGDHIIEMRRVGKLVSEEVPSGTLLVCVGRPHPYGSYAKLRGDSRGTGGQSGVLEIFAKPI